MAGLSLSSALSLSLSPRPSGGTPTPTPTAGASRVSDWTAAVGLTPALYYHPNTETVTKTGARLTGVSANSLSPALTTSATGPKEVTYANGIKAWRSDGSEYLDVPNTFAANPRQITVFMVARVHKHSTTNNYFSISYASDGITALAGGATFRGVGSSNTAPFMYNAGIASNLSATNKEFMVPGSQVQVMGLASRTTANGGTKFWNNKNPSDTRAQSGVTTTGTVGARIFGYVSSNGSTNFMDLLEIVVFAGELTDVQAQAVADYMTDRWGIVAITQNLLLEGDSITDGVTEVISGDNVAMAITEPGLGLIPANVRVLNMGKSGAQTSDMVTRRDATNGWPVIKIGANANDNVCAVQIGRNDTASGGLTAAQTYDAIKAYWNTATTGVVARGWKPVQFANIACDSGVVTTTLHDLITANFATDVTGGTVIDLQLIRDSDGGLGADFSPFVLSAQNGTYYQDDDGSLDTTHPSIYGTKIMGTGGDTPANGVAAAI